MHSVFYLYLLLGNISRYLSVWNARSGLLSGHRCAAGTVTDSMGEEFSLNERRGGTLQQFLSLTQTNITKVMAYFSKKHPPKKRPERAAREPASHRQPLHIPSLLSHSPFDAPSWFLLLWQRLHLRAKSHVYSTSPFFFFFINLRDCRISAARDC